MLDKEQREIIKEAICKINELQIKDNVLRENLIREEYIRILLSKVYQEEKAYLNEIKKQMQSFLVSSYSQLFSRHYISILYLRNFIKRLINMELLPSQEEYIKTHRNNEYFETKISIEIKNNDDNLVITFPYPLNINKVTSFVNKNNISKYNVKLSSLEKIIVPLEEFDSDMEAKKQGRDPMDKIKANNPIIVLEGGNIINPALINGNHRTTQAIRDKKENIEVYKVPSTVCRNCGITKNYEELYSIMENLYKRVYGVSKNNCLYLILLLSLELNYLL